MSFPRLRSRDRDRVIPVGIPGHEIPALYRPGPAPGEARWERLEVPAAEGRSPVGFPGRRPRYAPRHANGSPAPQPAPTGGIQEQEEQVQEAPQDETITLPQVPEDVTPAVRPVPVPPFAGSSEFPPEQVTGAFPAAGPAKSGLPRRVPASPVSGNADTSMAEALRVKLAAAAPEPPAPAGIGTLRRVRDALLPATLLRAVPRDGSDGTAKEVLSGWPEFAGLRVTETGQQVACLRAGGDGDVDVHLENGARDWWGRLAFEALRAEFAGLGGADLTRRWDDHIAWAMRMRDAWVYGGLQDGSAAAEDGDAA